MQRAGASSAQSSRSPRGVRRAAQCIDHRPGNHGQVGGGKAARGDGGDPRLGQLAVDLTAHGGGQLGQLGGVMVTSDAFWGVKWVEEVHEGAASLTLGLVVFHLLGVVASSLEQGENLVRAMITGRKRRQP